MVRVPAAFCALSLSALAAQASSIVTLPAQDGPAPSIVAMGSTEPPVPESTPLQETPFVLRGTVGDTPG